MFFFKGSQVAAADLSYLGNIPDGDSAEFPFFAKFDTEMSHFACLEGAVSQSKVNNLPQAVTNVEHGKSTGQRNFAILWDYRHYQSVT
jgi:hypothetical protein